MPDASRITALLGPTNTGKTHRAIERMLEHPTGMMGLPLRLLAREVYDRVCAKVGAERTALVTGEERRIPRRPDYWICTVESMPVDRDVAFVAVDEVQLAAHPQRGHVFTDRLLHARGTEETWFLGADTMVAALADLVPTARIQRHPRLSRLRHEKACTLQRLPIRSAVVAFSVPQVYEIAEKLRRVRGGAAVVLGALSPRTRNAQVAMFESGEVDHLVATDAIGMGLNLDVAHVAFTTLRKFDGREVRDLDDAEIGQIAGRAGRWIRDGTFGAVEPAGFPLHVAQAVEQHRYAAVQKVLWRSRDLDLDTLDGLIASLRAPPRGPRLLPHRDAEDLLSLEALARRPDVRSRIRRPDDVALLWDVATIPDYRKLLFESHVNFLAELFRALMDRGGRLDDAFIAAHVAPLRNVEGDVDTLTARIAGIRTWTFVSNRGQWLDDAARWRDETRAIEDALGDALHRSLVQRFIDVPARRQRRTASLAAEHAAREARHAPIKSFAELAARHAPPVPEKPRGVLDREELLALADAPETEFAITLQATVLHAGAVVARLVPGPTPAHPDVALLSAEALPAVDRTRLHDALLGRVRTRIDRLLVWPPGRLDADADPSTRGLLHQFRAGLGAADPVRARPLLATADATLLEALRRAGLVDGEDAVFWSRALKPDALHLRWALVHLHRGWTASPDESRLAAPVVPAPRNWDENAARALGYVLVEGVALRMDVLEKARVRARERDRPVVDFLPLDRGQRARVAKRMKEPRGGTGASE